MLPGVSLAAPALLMFASSHLGTPQSSPPPPSSQAPTASAAYPISADSLHSTVRARLTARRYTIEHADDLQRRLVVRLPEENTQVEVRVLLKGDSSALTVTPLAQPEPTTALRTILTATHDATTDIAPDASTAFAEWGDLPPSRWRPELFVTPWGRLWVARSGLYPADTVRAPWRRALGGDDDPVEADDLRIGISMAFVDDSTALLGLSRPSARTPDT